MGTRGPRLSGPYARRMPGVTEKTDVLGAEGLKGESVGDGARHQIGGIDLGQSQDLANMIAGVQPTQFQAFIIGLGIRCRRCRSIASSKLKTGAIRRRCQKAQHQALLPGAAALGDQSFGVLGILDILVTAIAARVPGNELVVEIDADPVGIGFDRHPTMRIGGRDGIVIGIQGDAELAGGNATRGLRNVVGGRIERL